MYHFFSRNLPLKDPNNIPDPYVKLLLLPGGTHKKQKTKVIHQNLKKFISNRTLSDRHEQLQSGFRSAVRIFALVERSFLSNSSIDRQVQDYFGFAQLLFGSSECRKYDIFLLTCICLFQAVLHLKDFNLSQSYTAWFDLCPEKDD